MRWKMRSAHVAQNQVAVMARAMMHVLMHAKARHVKASPVVMGQDMGKRKARAHLALMVSLGQKASRAEKVAHPVVLEARRPWR